MLFIIYVVVLNYNDNCLYVYGILFTCIICILIIILTHHNLCCLMNNNVFILFPWLYTDYC